MPTHVPTSYLPLSQFCSALRVPHLCAIWQLPLKRCTSTDASLPEKKFVGSPDYSDLRAAEPQALARLPTSSVLRSLFLGAFFSSSILFTPGFALLKKISDSPSRLLNPDRNPVLRAIVKPLVYDQFCAGTNPSEIQARMAQIKSLGFSGVILCYGRENQVPKPDQPLAGNVNGMFKDEELERWRQGNLETLEMLGEGDYLGIKFSGAGKSITNDLMQGNAAPEAFRECMDAILMKAITRKCRIWIDAEQQVLQPTIDRWTIDLMRKYNRGGQAVLYNTLQAYLKKSRQKLEYQLQLARQEGWTLAIKLVRGAYIENDIRECIHDTKAQTDDSYNGIVQDLLQGTVKGIPAEEFPKMQLFLAGHNAISVFKASNLIRELQKHGKLKTLPEFGQLQGMADQLGCELLQHGENTMRASSHPVAVPRVYKCLTWGSIQECMQFLVRRAVENRGATGAVKDGMPALARELRRRMVDALMGRRRTSG
ncbi:MAG: hypothetical protein Q9219_004084 [cf. Caloplaca sp. 3 TL-2023]